MPNKIDALYAEVSKTYDVGSIQDFQNYLADPKKRQLFFKDVIAPEYDVKSLDEFEQAYGLKKKESVSPSQQKKGATSSATGAMGPDGEPVSSASSSNKSSVPLWLQKQETPKPQATEESLPFMAPKPQGINLGSERVPEKGPMFGVGKPEFKEPEKIDKNLARLETSLVDMDEEQATEKLKYLFGDLGFTFDQAGYGYDAITVTSPSGKKLDLSWDNFSSKQDEYVLGQLTDFISKESKAPSNAAKLEKYYEESNKKFVDQREINETIATLSKKSDDVNKLIKGYVVKRDALENEGKVLEETPENLRDANWESRYNNFVENVNKLEEERLSVVDYQNNFEGNKSDIDMAVGKYMQTEEKMGWWGGVLLDSFLKGQGRVAASGTALFIDGIVNIMPTESLTGDYPERFVDAAKKLGYKVEDYKKLKTSLSEDQIEEINDKVDDELKKELKYKYGTLETARETNVKALGSDNVTKQYEAKFKEGFFGGAVAGLAESLPSMLGPSPARVLSMYSNITDNVSEEMENDPTLSKLSETEKSLVSVPIGIVSAILEEFGLRNVVANKGLLNKLVMRMLGKVSPGVTSRTFAELVRNDVESMVARGLLTVGGGALAEFETGAAQEASEQTIKAIYNKVKGDDVFKQIAQTPYEFIGDMMYAGAQEAVGGFVLGSIPAVSAAYRKTGFEWMSDIDFEKFERIANDDKVESAFVTSLKTQINSGEVSVEDAKQTLNDYRKSRGLYKQLPDNLTTENKKKAMNLLRERQELDQQISGKDAALVKPQKARIEEINSLLETISKPENNAVQEQTTSEVPVQPGAAVSGEVAQGEPQAEPQVVTEEGQAQKEVIPAGKRLFNEPNPETVEISKAYKEKNGIVEGEGVKIEAVDVDNASKIADAFEALEDSPNDPEVQDAYNAMADETAKQHQDIIDAGYEVEIWDGEGEPYANAQEMIDDVKNNKHMYIFSTEQGFGDEPITDEQRKQNKLLQDSGLKDKNGKPLLYNDMFRFVHDFFGHTERGNGFGPVGEENAWDVHARMYSPKARRAMTTETRGQNSWVNFGPQMRNEDGSLKKKGDPGYLSPKDRAFAPQKMALMPEEFTQIKEVVSGFDQAVNNSAQSLKMVAPDLKIIVAENTEDAQLQIAEALSAVVPTQAADVAEGFTTETRGQTVFVNGKPFAIVLDKSQADSKTVGHEAWELMLNDAFGDDQAKFKEFRDEIDRQLRLNGYGEIADALTKFSNQKGYEDVKYSEYMAELGGMLVADGFKQGSLDAKQKSLLQKIGDVINKFAQLFTGKKQFLDEATPEDILGFMVTISNKVAKGEDVSTFFREKNTQEIKDTKKVFSNRSQKIGDFDIQYFEDDAEFKDLVDRGLVVQNASIDEAGGQPVAIHQPDNLLVGSVNYKGKKIMEGNGGIYYVLKFGNVWASGKQTSAKTLSGYINKSRKESTDGIGRMVLVRGSQDKMISSVQGVKAAMRILEELVFDNLISTSDFRKALNAAGKSYNIDFSGSNSAKQIQKDIEDKFMNVSDSTFSDRGGFFSKLIDEIGKLESANKNIKEIRKALGTTKNIQFSREGIRKQIGTVLTERLLIGLDNSHAYAIVEVDEDVVVKKDDQHPSYPFSIVTKSGKPPVLKVFNYRPKAVEAITTMSGEKASNAQLGLAQMGMGMGRVASDKEIVVKSRSQKNVPAVVDEVLTDDGKGNYVFVHYSDELRDTIKPMSGSKKNFTSREEVSAISAVGGVAMYYTKQGQVESGVGNVPHTVLVPKDKVYFYGSTEKGTVSHDPEGFEEEARQRFQAYRNRGNEDRPTKYAFDANNSAAWVTKVAAENGYDMLVTNWGGPKSYRAQTTKALKPEAEYTGFKQIPEPTYEVGDEIFLYGRYATVVAVDGNTLSYESPNDFGRFDSGKFTLSPYTSNKIMLIEKAKPTVTTKSQKVVVNTIPGYERMMGEVEGILEKTMNRTGSYNQATANAVGYIQKSAVYERADDSQREQIIRDFVKLRGEKFKVAPSVDKILGQIKDTKKVTVNEKTALKDQIKLEAKAAKDAVAFVKQLRMQISNTLRGMAGRGVISAKQASTILARYDRMNILNPDMRDRFVDYMANVFQSAEYADKVKEATKLRKTIRKASKNPDNQAESSKLAKTFAEIDPSRVENIDDYLNNAEQILKSVSRKTGDVKMRSLVNMTDMVSYIDKEIQDQRKQIKNEILSKYQDLVDAGVLDSKMTINEIKKVVAAIEENEDESEAKAKEAKAAVKQMMDEVSPILLQIARTGEDPFTGDPIDLTQDEKAAIVKLAKMDLDNLSLAEAVKALEYANNFIANGVTSGIVGMVDLYEGSLNAEKLAKKGFKSIPFKKYFSKGAGRIWAEQIASLPMLNKLMWGSTSRALEVSEASGVTGVSNGKAKAIKIVEKAVKEYVATFSKVKGFLSSENVVERGMLAFVSRTVIGDEFQAQDEFNRRKSLIEETIQALKDPENSTDAEIKKGEVVEKVYNKILKDAKNVREVRVNVSDINQSAVDWWVNEWSKHYDRMDEVSRNVYNTLLSRDSNFTPDRFQLKEVSPAAEEDFDSGFFGNFENVSTEKSGSLKENKRIKNLPQNKNGVKTRIVNLDFDVNNVNALTNAMVDVETAGSVMQMKGFVTSKDFSKLFASKEDKNVYKKRLVSYVNRAKGQGYVDQSELKTLNRLVNAVASFGTAKALFSLSQPFKQSIPPLFNTLVQTGRLDLGTLMVGGFSFIDRTGYPIANRGISSQGELKSINRQLVEAEKNLLLRGVDGVAAYSNLMLELTLKYPDIMTARSSWLSFYKKGLKKEGIKTSGINWNTHEVNKKAADYAQMMVDSQQNISDSDMQGEFMASKDPAKAFLRRAIFPLMTFVLNQKTRIWADVRTLSNKAVTTAEDRQEAALSLAGALVELGAFSAISYAANSMLWEVAMNILAAVSGEDDDDDREEEKKKMILRRSAYTAQNFMKDFFVPPIPGADLLASKGINYILDETNLSSEIPSDWFGIEDDRVKFRLYDKENQGYLDMLGTQGIALEKALELADYYDIAIDGTFKEESYGTKREKQILEGDADMARINAAIMTGYYGGLLPADVAYIVGQINKKIKKRAEVVEEED